MYLVGLTLQAAVLGAVVAAALASEATIRDALDLPPARPTQAVAASLERIEQRLETIGGDLDRLAGAAARSGEARAETLADLDDSVDAIEAALAADGAGEDIARRLDVVERLLARVESKIDDVRDAQFFPAPTAEDALAP